MSVTKIKDKDKKEIPRSSHPTRTSDPEEDKTSQIDLHVEAEDTEVTQARKEEEAASAELDDHKVYSEINTKNVKRYGKRYRRDILSLISNRGTKKLDQ